MDPSLPQVTEAPSTALTNEIEFALVLARMIDSLKEDPEQLRSVVYELARHKLEEQFTQADLAEIQKARSALETAITGVETFFKSNHQPALLSAEADVSQPVLRQRTLTPP